MGHFTKISRLNNYIWLLLLILLAWNSTSCHHKNKTEETNSSSEDNQKEIIKQDSIMIIQDAPTIQNFDTELFKKNIRDENGSWEYKNKEGYRVSEDYTPLLGGIEPDSPSYYFIDTYSRTIYYPNNYLERYYYYNDGKPKGYIKYFSSHIETGIWYKFDKNGKVIERINKDEEFKFTLDDVIKFGLSHNVNFHDEGAVERSFNPIFDKKTYRLRWIIEDSKTKDRFQNDYSLDAQTGEILSSELKPAPIRKWR